MGLRNLSEETAELVLDNVQYNIIIIIIIIIIITIAILEYPALMN